MKSAEQQLPEMQRKCEELSIELQQLHSTHIILVQENQRFKSIITELQEKRDILDRETRALQGDSQI